MSERLARRQDCKLAGSDDRYGGHARPRTWRRVYGPAFRCPWPLESILGAFELHRSGAREAIPALSLTLTP